MSTIMVVDDMAIFREPIAASLRLAGYQTASAANGAEALTALYRQRPDLILLDVAMPVMDGMRFLQIVRNDPQVAHLPVILLSAMADKGHILQAARLGAKEYLLKSRFTVKDLLARIRKHLPAGSNASGGGPTPGAAPAGAASPTAAGPAPAAVTTAGSGKAGPPPARDEPIPRLLDREALLARAQSALQAKALSGVVAQVIALAASPRGDVTQLATLIARDPMLTARVLQAANSAAYASARGVVATIPEAVKHVGCSTVRNLAAALSIFEAMPVTGADGFNPIRCWQHSFAVAQLCERLAAGAADPDVVGVAYLVGLCHDLSEILLRTQFAREYQQLTEFQARTGRPRDELERAMLGMCHRDLVATVLGCIGLPDTIRAPIEAYHAGAAPGGRGPAALLFHVLRLADRYANGLLLASGPDALVSPLTRGECRTATGHDAPPPPDGALLRAEILGLTGALARLSRGEEAELTVPLFPRKAARVWLAREPGLSSFDPVQAALDSVAEVDAHDRLPGNGQVTDHRGLVVLARRPSAGGFGDRNIAQALSAFPAASGGAAAAGAVPVLWLVQGTDGAPAPDAAAGGAIRPVVWPVTLGAIHDFVQKV